MCKLVARLQIRFSKCAATHNHIAAEWLWHTYKIPWWMGFPIRCAAIKGHYHTICYLHENGVNIHADNERALRFAAECGHFQIVRYLHANGANIHACNDSALNYAARRGHYEVVRYLHENGANIHAENEYTLKFAAINGRDNIVRYLVENGADLDVAISNAEEPGTKQKLESYKLQMKNKNV